MQITSSICGRVAKDPELKRIGAKNTAVLSIPIVIKKYMGKGRDMQTNWYNVQLWGERAEKLQDHIEKGTFIAAVGDLEPRAYTSNGQPKVSLNFNVFSIQFDNSLVKAREEAALESKDSGPDEFLEDDGYDDDEPPF